MHVIAIFNASFCHEQQVVEQLCAHSGIQAVTDSQIVEMAASIFGDSPQKIEQIFCNDHTAFHSFTLEKKKYLSYLRLAVANYLKQAPFILAGYTSLLIPPDFSDCLKVCLVAHTSHRQQQAKRKSKLTDEQLQQKIMEDTTARSQWTELVCGISDPWNPELYDIVLPMDKTDPHQAAGIILGAANRITQQTGADAASAIGRAELAATQQIKLIQAGHDTTVSFDAGRLDILVNHPVLMRTRLEKELLSIVDGTPGVTDIRIRYRSEPAAHKPAFSKIMLVDDEREFVQTLSERLQMRQMESTAVYDGRSALNRLEEDDPEVMIIDLKMPGIDGIEVLRRVKQTRPEIEVIVLTGHGSEQDRLTCMALGAFAYLQKPVDIDLLSETLKAANQKINTQL